VVLVSIVPNYGNEFLAVAIAHMLAVASPGPDFAIVLKQSITYGRRTAVWTSIGVGCAIVIHVTYSVLGLGLLIRSSAVWFTVVKFAGATYLAWLGIRALCSGPRHTEFGSGDTPVARPRAGAAFLTGFLTNALNPKATLFFISIFVLRVDPLTPRWVQVGYGAWMTCATMAWFCFVSVVFAHPVVRARFLRHGHWIDRVLGLVLIAFAASLAVVTLR